jgi:hypothetical protein
MLPGKTSAMILKAILVIAASATIICAQTPQSSLERRGVSKEELDSRFQQARQLAGQRKYEEALREYLFVFDNSREASGYGGVRLSYVPSEIAEIGRAYRPAILALQERRNEREKRILAGRAESIDINELTSLNQYLNTPERNLELYDKLKTKGVAFNEIKEDMLMLIWEQLVGAERYNDLEDKINELAKGVVSQIAESVINNDFPSSDVSTSPMYQNYLRHSVIENGGKVYQASLALGRDETARKLEKWMLTFASDGEMYAQLISAAVKAKRSSVANDLLNRAVRTLKKSKDLQLVREAAKGLSAEK